MRSSAAGSTPNRRVSEFAAVSDNQMKGRANQPYTRNGGARSFAMLNGRAMATFLGKISPTTMVNIDAMVSASTRDTPAAAVSPGTFCYDLSYGLAPTPFSEWARAQGAAKSVMGWGMLVEQAAESFHVWRGVRPDTAPVLKQMKITA